MFKWFKKSQKPEERWRLVKTLEGYYTYKEFPNTKDDVVFYLYESNLGNRREERKSNCRYWQDTTTHPLYLKAVYPWIKGANCKDIPSYWDEAKEENEKYVKELYKRILKYGK